MGCSNNKNVLKLFPALKNDKTCFVLTNDKKYTSTKVAAFDLDWTLIKPKKGLFVKTKENLMFWDEKVPQKLKKLSDEE
ncbi:hypothetical protein MHBO_002936 [Bonamia ostreae]|uniref:FCP1 homology domain-containing protein n=1 Tax=Bonamia ostreae TaxID=126728 RepID=A0ABV2AP06_9EUKA